MSISIEGAIQDPCLASAQEVLIAPSRGRRKLDLRELWNYRELLWVLTARDIKVRYQQTLIGAAWTVFQPVVTMLVFTLIFGWVIRLPSEGFPYPLFLYSGLLPWTFFSNALSSSGGSLVSSSNLVSKVYFPRLVIPIASVGAGLVNLAISLTVLIGLMTYYGIGWTANLLFAPLLIAAVSFAALGIGTFLSALNVAYRDVGNILPLTLQIWMFLTPILYSPTMVPERWRWLIDLNPMTGIVGAFRTVFLGQPWDHLSLAISLGLSCLFFWGGLLYFQSVERDFADVI